MEEKSAVEKIAGSLTANIVTTTISVLSGNPIASLLPVLHGSLANTRHQKRIENALKEIEETLSKQEESIKSLTDAQYKFINEAILTILHSPDDKKIELLKRAITNSIEMKQLKLHESGLIARIIRDITTDEMIFLANRIDKKIVIHDQKSEPFVNISNFSIEGEMLRGLISLGLFAREKPESTWDDDAAYVATPLANKIVNLIR